MPAQGIMVEIGDAGEDEDVEEEAGHAHRLQTMYETRRWQEDVGEWHLQEQDTIHK